MENTDEGRVTKRGERKRGRNGSMDEQREEERQRKGEGKEGKNTFVGLEV